MNALISKAAKAFDNGKAFYFSRLKAKPNKSSMCNIVSGKRNSPVKKKCDTVVRRCPLASAVKTKVRGNLEFKPYVGLSCTYFAACMSNKLNRHAATGRSLILFD